MLGANDRGWLKGGPARKVLTAVLVLEAVVIVLIVAYERGSHQTNPAPIVVEQHHSWGRRHAPEPIRRPEVLKASQAKLGPDEPVIGVEVGGRARAYRLAAMEDDAHHLVNDLIGGVPVSVAYCNVSHCIRVYTDPQGSQPLDAEVPGLINGQMVIKLGGTLYFHESGKAVEPGQNPTAMPYAVLTPTVTTWKEWTRRHPDTDVYDGGF
jgi:hypothetical protein